MVLLLDEFEVLAGFDTTFWEWFEGLVNEYDISIIATTRMDLGRFRAVRSVGPPFFNMFRTVRIGSFEPETVDLFLKESASVVALVKPQFEVGRELVGKGGIVKDPSSHELAISRVRASGEGLGWKFAGLIESPIHGAKGNKEFLIQFRK